jgi:hypothetical protein
LAHRADDELLSLLGDVYVAMGDQPAAGAAWFPTARRGADVDEALAAWRARHGADPIQLWLSLPRVVRVAPVVEPVRTLRDEAVAAVKRRNRRSSQHIVVNDLTLRLDAGPRSRYDEEASGFDFCCAVVVLVVLVVLVLMGVGAWTIVEWMR